ncbi:serine/threonine specific protein phosphatase [Besnoitia besnoiti]|uniref:Serine/threonine specific protein phosphatase n=1 Tax=Besnoitia besnoiti TaxID=94643 RepID=A0A2A9M9R4_BESBE|nr:serine/threonine specific protein phosphatase [Besnoitia besnoiti]PFH32112.1 serine/threonine specific protein phosphatase [Besnoitia besnoiti]
MNTTTEVKCVHSGRLEVPCALLEEAQGGAPAWRQESFEWRSVRVFLDDAGLRFWNNVISILDIATVDVHEAATAEGSRLVLIHMDQAFPTLSNPYPPFFTSATFFPSGAAGASPPGQTTLVFRIPALACEEESDYGNLVKGLELLQKTVAFLGDLRPMFRTLRDHAIAADEIRTEFLAFQLREGGALVRQAGSAVADKFLRTLPPDRVKLLYAGFLQRDCSVLEEAIAYVPVAIYEHLREGIALLSHLSVDPTRYRVWRQAFLKANADNPELCECLATPTRARLLAEASPRKGAKAADKKLNLKSASSIHMGVPLPLRLPEVLPFSLSVGGCRISKGRTYRCEDAYFFLEHEGAFGVFDGVGSWAAEGIDASKFSTALATACRTLAQEHLQPTALSPGFARLNVNLRARELLGSAHAKVRRESPDAWGSSTAVVGVFDRYLGQLGVACLGDSVLTVLRRQMMPRNMQFMAGGASEPLSTQVLSSSPTQVPRLIRKIRYRSAEQRWSNGAPYQLSNLPAEDAWDELRSQGHERFVQVLQRIDNVGDSADMALGPPQPLVLHPGDLVLLYSDGVADNLFDKEIEVFASLAISPEEAVAMGFGKQACTKAQDIADMICKLARRRAADRPFDKPFVPGPIGARHVPPGRGDASAASARKGAKRDDISCVAIWIEGLPDPAFNGSLEPALASASGAAAASPPPTEVCMTSTTVSEESLEGVAGVLEHSPDGEEEEGVSEEEPNAETAPHAPEARSVEPAEDLRAAEASAATSPPAAAPVAAEDAGSERTPSEPAAPAPAEPEAPESEPATGAASSSGDAASHAPKSETSPEKKARRSPRGSSLQRVRKGSFSTMRAGSRIPLPPRAAPTKVWRPKAPAAPAPKARPTSGSRIPSFAGKSVEAKSKAALGLSPAGPRQEAKGVWMKKQLSPAGTQHPELTASPCARTASPSPARLARLTGGAKTEGTRPVQEGGNRPRDAQGFADKSLDVASSAAEGASPAASGETPPQTRSPLRASGAQPLAKRAPARPPAQSQDSTRVAPTSASASSKQAAGSETALKKRPMKPLQSVCHDLQPRKAQKLDSARTPLSHPPQSGDLEEGAPSSVLTPAPADLPRNVARPAACQAPKLSHTVKRDAVNNGSHETSLPRRRPHGAGGVADLSPNVKARGAETPRHGESPTPRPHESAVADRQEAASRMRKRRHIDGAAARERRASPPKKPCLASSPVRHKPAPPNALAALAPSCKALQNAPRVKSKGTAP